MHLKKGGPIAPLGKTRETSTRRESGRNQGGDCLTTGAPLTPKTVVNPLRKTEEQKSFFLELFDCVLMGIRITNLTALEPLLSVQCSDVKDSHHIVSPPPESISRTFSSSRTETAHPLKNKSPLSPPAGPGLALRPPVPRKVPVLGASRKWDHATGVLLCPTHFT